MITSAHEKKLTLERPVRIKRKFQNINSRSVLRKVTKFDESWMRTKYIRVVLFHLSQVNYG